MLRGGSPRNNSADIRILCDNRHRRAIALAQIARQEPWASRDGYLFRQLKLEFPHELILSQGSSLSVLTQLRSYRCI
jgi:hypothetical protein